MPASSIAFLFVAVDGRLRAGWRFLLAVVVFLVANMASRQVLRGLVSNQGLYEALFRPLTLLLLLAAFSAMLYLLDRVRRNPLTVMGLGTSRPWKKECLKGTLLGAGMVAAAVAAIAVVGELSFQFVRPPAAWAVPLSAVLWVLASAAMLEEVAFRGYPFQKLVEGIGPVGATVLLSVLFGVLHLSNPHASLWGFLNTVAIGVVLSIAYLRTGALWLPWGIHFGWNAMLGLVFGLPVSGTTGFSVLVAGTAHGPLWLTGGGYGIEASATGAVVVFLGLAALWRMTSSPETAEMQAPFPERAKHPFPPDSIQP